MRRLILLTGTFFCLTQTQAQDMFAPFLKKDATAASHRKKVKQLLQNQSPATAQKPTGTKQRLIGIHTLSSFDGEDYEDTTALFYSGIRGSAFNLNSLQYNTEIGSQNMLMGEILVHDLAFVLHKQQRATTFFCQDSCS